jgi:hypothetical protein
LHASLFAPNAASAAPELFRVQFCLILFFARLPSCIDFASHFELVRAGISYCCSRESDMLLLIILILLIFGFGYGGYRMGPGWGYYGGGGVSLLLTIVVILLLLHVF